MSKISAHLPSSITPFSVISQIARRIRIVPLVVLLIATVPAWFLTEALAPQLVRAYTARVDLAIDRLPDENYETVLTRAEAAARSAAQRSFDQDILVTDVSIIVSVQNYGSIAPVLTLQVSRPEWRSRPDAQNWATYFKTARSLLFFEKEPTSNPVPAASSLSTPK
ncbi:hypothetical protein [Nostoc sp.]|uniref:hypothetical protein n=1 Tax=Nostoc sp. TaxID=1180 RepID=UPI002FF6B7C5